MGIKNLKIFLKEKAPAAFEQVSISRLRGTKIAIDTNNWMYSAYTISRKRVIERMNVSLEEPSHDEVIKLWLGAALDFVMRWLTHGVIPIFVFDGKHPEAKDGTKLQRRAERDKLKHKIEEGRSMLQNLDVFDRPTADLEQLRKNLINCNEIAAGDYDIFRNFLKDLGLPVIQAIGEGERLCAFLCLEGKVSAVFSADTDNLVYGCPLLITNFSKGSFSDIFLDTIRLDRVLEGLNLPFSVFVDFCICCGTDYNKNMPGYATKKCYDLILKYLNIDLFPKKFDLDILQHRLCRELFTYQPSESLIEEGSMEPLSNPEKGPLAILKIGGKIAPSYFFTILERSRQEGRDTFFADEKILPVQPYLGPEYVMI